MGLFKFSFSQEQETRAGTDSEAVVLDMVMSELKNRFAALIPRKFLFDPRNLETEDARGYGAIKRLQIALFAYGINARKAIG